MSGGGGAWKVAYADFVTAMMALFMVLWISAQDQEILIATSQYFQTPFRSPLDGASGVLPSNDKAQSSGNNKGSEGMERNRQIQMTFLNSVAADFHRLLHLDTDLEGKSIEIQVTSDGLRVMLFDRLKRRLFQDGSTELTEWGKFVLQSLAWVIDRHGFHVTIDGHAGASAAIETRDNYSKWELSADRANAARRTLVHFAVTPTLIERVTGYADTRPMANEPSDSELHERVTLNLSLSANRFRDGKLVEKHIPIVEAEKLLP